MLNIYIHIYYVLISFKLLEKCMNKWRTDERRSKKESFTVARENEKVQDMTSDASYSILTSNANLAKDATKVIA